MNYKENKNDSEQIEWLDLQIPLEPLGIKPVVEKIRKLNDFFAKFYEFRDDLLVNTNQVYYRVNEQIRQDYTEARYQLLSRSDWDQLLAEKRYGKITEVIRGANDKINSIIHTIQEAARQESFIFSYILGSNKDVDNLKSTLTNLNKQALHNLEDIEKLKTNALALESNYISESQQTFLKSYENQFNDFANGHRKQAFVWLVVLIAALIISPVVIAFLTQHVDWTLWSQKVNEDLRQVLRVPIFVVCTSFYAWFIFFLSKNYSVNRNQQIIYRQKHTMVITYIPFIQSIQSVDVERGLLSVEIGKVIFNVVPSGLVKQTGEADDTTPSGVVELARLINGK